MNKLFTCNEPIEEIRCRICELNFNLMTDYKRHHHYQSQSQQSFKYFCSMCNFETYSFVVSERHKKECRKLSLDPHKQVTPPIWFECDQCDYKFENEYSLRGHILAKHKFEFECKQCNFKCKLEDNLLEHIQCEHTPNDQRAWLSCDYCENKYKFFYMLKSHVLESHSEHFHKCEHCNHIAKSAKLLKRHLSTKHQFDDCINWFYCEQCTMKFKSEQFLQIHMFWQHTCDRVKLIMYEHSYCKTSIENELKFYDMAKQLTTEMIVYQCPECDYKSDRIDMIRNHIHVRHEDTNVWWLSCDQCGCKFKDKYDLESHRLWKHINEDFEHIIKWFKCGECEFKCRSLGEVSSHFVREHTKK